MIALVESYYVGERNTALVGVAVGVALVVLAVAMWRRSRGMAITLGIAGVLLGVASGAYVPISATRGREAVAAYAKLSDRLVGEREAARLTETLSDFVQPIAIDASLVVIGLIMVLAFRKARGIGFALIIAGTAALGVEALSVHKHQQYRDDIAGWRSP